MLYHSKNINKKDHMSRLLGASEVSANLYCNSRTSVLGRSRDYLRLLMKRSVREEMNVLREYNKRGNKENKKKIIINKFLCI